MILPADLSYSNGRSILYDDQDEDDSVNDQGRDYPLTHPPAEAPLCGQCQQTEAAYFDLSCLKCLQLLLQPQTTISQIFAVMRQWNPHTQRSIKFCIQQILEKGGNVNDRDSVSDMTLLHFACKAGAAGIGDPQVAAEVVQDLISRCADVYARCKWTQMTPLHYSALFDASAIIQILLNASQAVDIDGPCNDYENGSALHIAAANLAFNSAVVLVEFGANTKLKDNLGRTPFDCIPDKSKYQHMPHTEDVIDQLQQVLSRDTKIRRSSTSNACKLAAESVAGRAMLKTMALNIGDRILVDKAKPATLRYCGTVDFASGVWVGVELDSAEGKNDGVIQDTIYFKCSPNHGLFVPLNRVSKFPSASSVKSSSASCSSGHLRSSPPRQSQPPSKTSITLSNSGSLTRPEEFHVGDMVIVTTLSGTKHRGLIRFCGETRFATGTWYGIELDKPDGRNNGSVQGIQYFTCPDRHGIFATASKLKKIPEEPSEAKSPLTSLTRRSSLHTPPKTVHPATIRRSLSARHRENGGVQPQQPQSLPLFKQKTTPRMENGRTEANKPEWKSIPLMESNKPVKKKGTQHWLDVGMNVLFNHQVGVIKYIGRVNFADGVWLGLEMRDHVGRHDGQVQGHRYFHCKANRGLMVRPSSVTVRGINGATLIKPT